MLEQLGIAGKSKARAFSEHRVTNKVAVATRSVNHCLMFIVQVLRIASSNYLALLGGQGSDLHSGGLLDFWVFRCSWQM